MALFHFGKKDLVKRKEEEKTAAGSCGCDGSVAEELKEETCGCSEVRESKTEPCSCCEAAEGIRSVKVLGTGCKACHEQYENAKAAAASVGLAAEVEYITDMEKIMSYGVMRMPAVVINEKVVSMGRIMKTAEVEQLFRGGQK